MNVYPVVIHARNDAMFPQPTKHDPCRVPVDKNGAPCGHKIRFQCALTPSVADCSHPVLKRLPCDHAVEVPCRIALVTIGVTTISLPNSL